MLRTYDVCKIIKSLRKERGYTQEVLAEKVGVSFQAVSKWENDIGMPDVSQIVPIARVFGVSTDVLFAYECDEDENVEKIISDVEESDVSILDNYPKLLDAVKLYPNNETLLRYALKHGKWIMISHFRRREKDKERAEVFKNIGIIGNINLIEEDAFKDKKEMEWFKEHKDTSACLIDGYCTKPIVDGQICERLLRRQKCYTCSRYITTPEYLDTHRRHLMSLEKQVSEGAFYGKHYIEHFIPTIKVLKSIISRLEELQDANN